MGDIEQGDRRGRRNTPPVQKGESERVPSYASDDGFPSSPEVPGRVFMPPNEKRGERCSVRSFGGGDKRMMFKYATGSKKGKGLERKEDRECSGHIDKNPGLRGRV